MPVTGYGVDNLGDVMVQVEDVLSYYPDSADWRKKLRSTINRVYQEICGEEDWDFLYKDVPFWLMPDLELDNDQAITADGLGGTTTREVTVSSIVLPGFLGQFGTANFTVQITSIMEGATFDVIDYETAVTDTVSEWFFGPFVIEEAQPAGTKDFIITLDPMAKLDLFQSGNGDYTGQYRIRWDHYRLPPDCHEVISLYEPENARILEPWGANEMRRANLKEQKGTPSIYYRTNGHVQRRAQSSHSGLNPLGSWPGQQFPGELTGRMNENPGEVPVGVSANVTGGELDVGSKYRVFYSWYFAGRYSAPSPVLEVTIGAGHNGITLTEMPTPAIYASTDPDKIGRKLTVWVSRPEGAFYLSNIIDPTDPPTTTDDVKADYPKGVASVGSPAYPVMSPTILRWDDVYQGPYQYISVYPRPTVPTRHHLSYKKIPRPLIEDADAPEMDRPFRSILVHAAIVELAPAAKGDSLKQTHAQLYEKVLKAMRRKHLTGVRRSVQKGRIDRHRGRVRYPTPDYKGP